MYNFPNMHFKFRCKKNAKHHLYIPEDETGQQQERVLKALKGCKLC